MNNIQNYDSFNVNANYGKVNKSPNFKAMTYANGGKEALEKMGKNVEEFVTNPKVNYFTGIKGIDDNLIVWIEKLKAGLKLKKASTDTNYFDGVFVGGSLDSGIKSKNSDTIYTTPFRFSEKKGGRVIEGKLLQDVTKDDQFDEIIELTEEEAAKLHDFSAASVLEACENSIKQKINQIQNMAKELMQ